MRFAGVNPMVLRLPAIAAGTLCCLLVYLWLRRSGSMAAASGILLLAGSAIFHDSSRRFMTDILLTALIVGCMFLLSFDTRLERKWSAAGFGLLTGAAILTKSAAGLVPLVVLFIYFFLLPVAKRPPLRSLWITASAAVLVAAPWHLYQLVVHREWFLAEYISFQLFGSGLIAPSRYSNESNLAFYARRLLEMDPVLLLLCSVALSGAALEWKRADWETSDRPAQLRLLTAWCIASSAALLLFGTRVAYYLLPLLPALTILSIQFSPLFRGRWAMVMCGVLAAALGVKAANGGAPWGVDYRAHSVAPAATLEKYARLRRANTLVIVAPDDEFYATVLDLPKVRYLYPGELDATKTAGFFEWLGVDVSTDQFCSLPSLAPIFAQHLASWKENSAVPIGAMIFARADSDVGTIVRCTPDSDFLLPARLRGAAAELAAPAHVVVPADEEHFFLLAKQSVPRRALEPQPGTLLGGRRDAANQGFEAASNAILVTTTPNSRPSLFVDQALSRTKFTVTKPGRSAAGGTSAE